MQAAGKLALLSRVMKDAETLRDYIESQGGFTNKESDPGHKDWEMHPVQSLRNRYYSDTDYQPDAAEHVVNMMADMVVEAKPEVQGKAIKQMMALPTIQNMNGSDEGLQTIRNVLCDMVQILDPSTKLAGIQAVANLPISEIDYRRGRTVSDMKNLVLGVPESRRWAAIEIVADSAVFKAHQKEDPKLADNKLIEMVASLPKHDPRQLGQTEVAVDLKAPDHRRYGYEPETQTARLVRLPDRKGQPVLGLAFSHAVDGEVEYTPKGTVDLVHDTMVHRLGEAKRASDLAKETIYTDELRRINARKEHATVHDINLMNQRALTGLFGDIAVKKEQDDPKLAAELRRVEALMRSDPDARFLLLPNPKQDPSSAPAAAA